MTVPVDGLPFLIKPGLDVALVPPDLDTDRFQTVSGVQDGARGQLVSFEGISKLDQAEGLAGKYVLAREEDLDFENALMDARAAVGLSVTDVTRGYLGEVVDVMLGPVQDVWVVDGPFGEVLIPAVDAMVKDIDGDDATVDVPRGLVEGDRV